MSEASRTKDIGLCLSGGGARAMAFHLGCMKALEEEGLLGQVSAISAVSGGSVLAALYCCRDEPFADFERRTIEILQRGLLRDIVCSLFPLVGLNALLAFAVAGLGVTVAWLVKQIVWLAPLGWRTKTRICRSIVSPIPRWASRTEALERALRSPRLLGPVALKDLPAGRPELTVNAADLKTQAAFRFSAKGSGSWRHGAVVDAELTLSQAVAASAAFPILLPAIERTWTFEQGGKRSRRTVLLTDGGVYDNLGLTTFHPTRPDRYSFGARKVPYIIACVSESGIPAGADMPRFLLGRLTASFATAHRQLHSSEYSNLHDWLRMGSIEGFMMPYLGQDDSKIPHTDGAPEVSPIGDLAQYPVDFSPMPKDVIEGLMSRGYSMTRRFIHLYPRSSVTI